MLTTIVAAMTTMAVLQTASLPDRTLRERSMNPASTATTTATRNDIDTPIEPPRAADEHLQTARRAMTNGDFDIARREFQAAAALDRDAGKLPVEAMTGLADALYAQAYNVEAAITMLRLADAAALVGDVDTEAVALADAIWLNADAGQRLLARKQTERLRALMKDTPLSVETRKAIRNRLG